MKKNKAHSLRDDLEIAAHAMGLNEIILSLSPRLVTSALAFLAACYGVLFLVRTVVCGG